MISEFRGLLKEWVTIQPYRVEDSYTEPTWGDPVRVPAKIMGQERLVFDAQGRQIISRHRIILGSKMDVSLRDKLTITGRDPSSPVILGVDYKYDERGRHHTELHTD